MTRLALLVLLVAGCAPPWTVLRRGATQPGATQLAIDTTTFDELLVGKQPEAAYLATLQPDQQQAWQDDKVAFVGAFSAAVLAHRGELDVAGADRLDGRALVRSHVVMMKPGEFNGFFNTPTEIRTRVTITDASQATIDELELRCVVPADLYRPSVRVRVTECASDTGRNVARYLRQRLR